MFYLSNLCFTNRVHVLLYESTFANRVQSIFSNEYSPYFLTSLVHVLSLHASYKLLTDLWQVVSTRLASEEFALCNKPLITEVHVHFVLLEEYRIWSFRSSNKDVCQNLFHLVLVLIYFTSSSTDDLLLGWIRITRIRINQWRIQLFAQLEQNVRITFTLPTYERISTKFQPSLWLYIKHLGRKTWNEEMFWSLFYIVDSSLVNISITWSIILGSKMKMSVRAVNQLSRLFNTKKLPICVVLFKFG